MTERTSSPAEIERGERVAIVANPNHVMEIDFATGKVLRRIQAGNDQIGWPAYVGDRLLVPRGTWVGDLWIADLPP